MSPLKSAQRLLDRLRNGDQTAADDLEVLIRSYLTDVPEDAYGVHLSSQERRLMDRLFCRPGQLVSRDALLDALYFDAPDSTPAPAVPGVQIHRLRKKLANTKYQIPVMKPWDSGYKGLIAA